jgi:hypothetical protein
MISDANSGASGVGDGPYLRPTQHNKIVGMMLNPRRRWRLSKEAKQAAMMATLTNLDDEDGRVRNAAVANLIRMEGQNQADQHKAIDKRTPDLHAVAGTIDHRITAQELLTHPNYVEWLRSSEVDCESRAICANGHAGNGKPVDDGPSRNGH